MVAPFVEPPPPPVPAAPDTQKPLPAVVDVPVAKQLPTPKTTVQKAARVEIPVAETPTLVPVGSAWAGNPDRAKIAELANKHMPEVVRGDTAASYIVMAFDASDNYVWGTYGAGSVRILVTGDKRTTAERNQFNLTHAIDYTGTMPGARGAGAGGGGRGGAVARADRRDTMAVMIGTGRSRGGAGGVAVGRLVGDSNFVIRMDSMRILDSTARPGVIARQPSLVLDSIPGAYTIGTMSRVNGSTDNLNSAAGLQLPGNGESGIQGLKATSVTMGERYLFAPGQLGSRPIQVFAIHLAPGTNWKGR
jgi:hypothetical protein